MDAQLMRKIITLLPAVCRKETSSDPLGWSRANPLWGHSDVIALFIREMFGGSIACFSLENIQRLANLHAHYLNMFQDGTCEDFAFEQHRGELFFVESLLRNVDRALTENAEVMLRYHVFAKRIRESLEIDGS